jgi:hypothetical protein
MARTQIGTVQITRTRVYLLDPAARPDDVTATTVLVEPGEYPVYQDGISFYWRMTGVLNHQSYRIGDGMFEMNSGDKLSEDDVAFYSRRYGPDEWDALLAGFAAEAEPRLVFTLLEGATS